MIPMLQLIQLPLTVTTTTTTTTTTNNNNTIELLTSTSLNCCLLLVSVVEVGLVVKMSVPTPGKIL